LINEEALLFTKYLRIERKTGIPRILNQGYRTNFFVSLFLIIVTARVAVRNKGRRIIDGNSGIGSDVASGFGSVKKGTKDTVPKPKSYL